MLNVAQRFLTNVPIWPGLAIFLVVLSLNLAATACAMRSIRGSGEPS
jgi:ABC-type dipeptide/oligopeptide/nickel transport system permease subunit